MTLLEYFYHLLCAIGDLSKSVEFLFVWPREQFFPPTLDHNPKQSQTTRRTRRFNLRQHTSYR